MHRVAIGKAELEQLSEVLIFSQLPDDLLAELFAHASAHTYDENTILFLAGDEADGFYVVLEGEVHLTALTAEGAQSLVRVVEAGESFAEAAMIGLGRFPINATAQTGALLVKVPKAGLEEKLREDAAVGLHILSALIQRQQYLIREIKLLKSQSPCQRVASFLLTLYETESWEGHGALPYVKQVIAARIGIDPASLSRALRRLEEAGIVCEGHEVIISDVDKLRAYCAEFGHESLEDLLRLTA